MVTRRQSGFTMVEVITVVAIAAILAAFAIPSLKNMLTTQGVRTAAYDLYADLTFARSEAISRGVNVSVISAAGVDWKQGWAIFSPTSVLRSEGAKTTAIVFQGNTGTYTFDKTGRLIAGSPAQWGIRPSDTAHTQAYQKRCIQLDPSGRPRTQEGNSCGY